MLSVDCPERLEEAYCQNDWQEILVLFEEESRRVSQSLSEDPFTMKPLVRIEPIFWIKRGDVAMIKSHWHVWSTNREGEEIETSFQGLEWVRKQPNGTWLFIHELPLQSSNHFSI